MTRSRQKTLALDELQRTRKAFEYLSKRARKQDSPQPSHYIQNHDTIQLRQERM